MGERVRVVCFDWGGVILRICRSFAQGCEQAGLEMRLDTDDRATYDARRAASARFQVGQIDEDAFFAYVASTTGGLYTPEEIARIHDAWLIEEYPGVADLVNELHTRPGVETAMLSNTNARHWGRRLSDFPTAGTLRHQHASHLLGLIKPDEAIFRALEREVRAGPGEIMFFDDLVENVEAARGAGWRAVLIDPEGDTPAQMRTHLGRAGVL